jgi:pimeloyl-ACP methyl ester carboxylesterase
MTADHPKEVFLAQQQAMMNRPDVREDLGRIRCHTVVVCGEQDMVTPPQASQAIAAAIPRASYVPIPHSGHMVTLEQPVAVSSLLRYWLQLV